MRRSLEVILITLALGAGAGTSFGQYMYWTDRYTGKVQRSFLDGSGVTDIYTNRPLLGDLEIDEVNDQMFFADDGKIIRADLDGSGGTSIVSGIPDLGPIALDVPNQRVFWVEDDGTSHKIRNAKFDGTDVQTAWDFGTGGPPSWTFQVTELEYAAGAHPFARNLYWAQSHGVNSAIRRLNLYVPSPAELILSLPDQGLTALAIDAPARLIYFMQYNLDGSSKAIQRIDFEGGGLTTVLSLEQLAFSVTPNPRTSFLYWGTLQTVDGPGGIWRATKTGGNPTMLVADLEFPIGIALELDAGICPARTALDELSQQLHTPRVPLDFGRVSKLPGAVRRQNPLGALREFRDEVLRGTPEGRRLVELYYRHGREMSRLMKDRPDIAFRTVALFVDAAPAVRSAIGQGDLLRLETSVYRRGLELMKTFESRASPELKTALREVRGFLAVRARFEGREVWIDFAGESGS